MLKKNRNRTISSLVLGLGSRRSPSGFVRSDTNRSRTAPCLVYIICGDGAQSGAQSGAPGTVNITGERTRQESQAARRRLGARRGAC